MSRPNFRREMVSWTLLPIMLGGIDSGTVAVFVKKAFTGVQGVSPNVLNYAVAAITSAKAVGLLTSFLWARAGHSRPKIRFIVRLQVLAMFLIASVAMVPRTLFGLALLTTITLAAWLVWSGVTTLKTGVWRANFPAQYRARVTGKIATMNALATAATGACLGASLDWNPSSYRWIFPVFAAIGFLGIQSYGRIRFRGEKRLLIKERSVSRRERPSFNPLRGGHVLIDDKPFRNYMACMFMLGIGNLMLHAPLAIILGDVFDVSYSQGIAITSVIPLVMLTLSVQFWGRLLDGMHVTKFRAIQGWAFVVTTLLFWIGAAASNLNFLYLGAAALGVGYGGGALAWNLGHQHFAQAHRDSQYMSVHVTLTGIRGLLGPLLAVTLYQYLSRFGAGSWVFGVCLAFNLIGTLGFGILALRLRKENQSQLY